MNRNTSIFLDLLRLLAALFVVVSHFSWRKISGGALPYLPGHAAVMVFFVLSGYVIAYAATQRESGPQDYVLNRMSRLWSVALPALLLTACLDHVGQLFDQSLYPAQNQADPLGRLLVAALFVSQIWFLDITPLSNEPFWSLPYEFWFYVLLGVRLHLRGRARLISFVAVALVAGPKILLYLPIWWLGVWLFSRPAPVITRARALSVFSVCAALLPLLYLLGYRTRFDTMWLPTGISPFDYPFALCVAGMIWSFGACGLALTRVEKWVRRGAAFTFSIYLFHLPILLALTASVPVSLPAYLRLPFVLGLTLLACVCLANLTERRKNTLRRWLESVASNLALATRDNPRSPKLPERSEP